MNKILRIIFIIFVNLLLIQTSGNADDEKIKIGLLVPMSGDDKDLGQLLIKSTRLALKDINNIKLEIFPIPIVNKATSKTAAIILFISKESIFW